MQTIERVALEVRESIGLFGPLEAKTLAVWMELDLEPVAYPCDGWLSGRCDNGRPRAVSYYAMAGEVEAQQQIARAVCTLLLCDAGVACPRAAQVGHLATLLCGAALAPLTDAA